MKDDLLDILRKMRVDGVGEEEIMVFMLREGVSITEAIILVRSLYGVGLGAAKRIVSGSSAWSAAHRANKNLHDALEDFAKKEGG